MLTYSQLGMTAVVSTAVGPELVAFLGTNLGDIRKVK